MTIELSAIQSATSGASAGAMPDNVSLSEVDPTDVTEFNDIVFEVEDTAEVDNTLGDKMMDGVKDVSDLVEDSLGAISDATIAETEGVSPVMAGLQLQVKMLEVTTVIEGGLKASNQVTHSTEALMRGN